MSDQFRPLGANVVADLSRDHTLARRVSGEPRANRKLYRNRSLERFRTSSKYQDRPAAHIAFCVTTYANGMTKDRVEREDQRRHVERLGGLVGS